MGENNKHWVRRLGEVFALGLEVGLSVVVGILIGSYLDKKFNTDPWLFIIFLILGALAGFKRLLDLSKRIKDD